MELFILTHDYHTGEVTPKQQLDVFTDRIVEEGSVSRFPLNIYSFLLGKLFLFISYSKLRSSLCPIRVIDEHVATGDLPRLYKVMHSVVIASHGEGWGRPHVEAMAMELPLIATNWSGPTEFMTEANSYALPIEPQLVPVGKGKFLFGDTTFKLFSFFV